MIRYDQTPRYLWMGALSAAAFFWMLDLYALSVNLRLSSGWDYGRLRTTLLPELWITSCYALLTATLQLAVGGTLAGICVYFWGKESGWSTSPPRTLYLSVLPYFIPIVTFAAIAHQWAVVHNKTLDGGWGWLLLLSLSVWEFYPFVLLLVFEELRTIPASSWSQLQVEGGGFKDALRYLIWPRLLEIGPAIFLVRFLWMYTKVDVILFLFHENSRFAAQFIHFNVFRSVFSQSIEPEVGRRATIMIFSAVLITICAIPVLRSLGVSLSMVTRQIKRQIVGRGTYRRKVHTISGGRSLRIGGLLSALLFAISVGPISFPVYCSFRANDLLGPVTRSDLWAGWVDLFSSSSLTQGGLRWCVQTVLLACVTSIVYSCCMSLLAYALHRERRLSYVGQENKIRWVPIAGYSLPVIAIAYPVCELLKLFDYGGQWAVYAKLVVVHGFYLWPVTLWLAYKYLSTIRDKGETAAVCEGAGMVQTLRIAVMPIFKGRFIALWILAFAISFNELIFGLYLVNNSEYYTLPIGLFNAFATRNEGNSAANLLVITTIAVAIAAIPTLLLSHFMRVQSPEGVARG